MSAATELQHPIGPHTVEEWRNAEHPSDGGRLELIWGYFHVSPPPGGPHQYATGALYRALWDAVRAAGRKDLHPVLAVGVEITTALRTALIPDVAVLNRPPTEVSYPAEALELVVEVWSPGNTSRERETKVAAYAAAGVPYLWTVEQRVRGRMEYRAYELVGGVHKERVCGAGDDVLVDVPGPVALTLVCADLDPER
ncbi:Endonuclease, Uma2 family (restriction endonuclease fold) [Streptoalloteichus hindustanus]|uniref:Endonuclease, Uma2 family (Restriction endonuclease fold) n=1 Tax=Streptoalloteichus hindustanus TaxID=2017 RepID=A0A1M5BAF9_STRHI|nr:Endonuclease, Uma2 family (restriction endonuclease fold) [Streptoalloteichus hindustanus]